MGGVVRGIGEQVEANAPWMGWNLLLALAPWLLSLWLFRTDRHTSRGWWAAAVLWLLLLPNAAYVLTDVIHLPGTVRRESSDAVVLFGILPMYSALFVVGFVAYADALRRMSGFALARGWAAHATIVELTVHALSAVAIYAGRVHRLNSWDALLQPGDVLTAMVDGFTRPLPVAGMVATFCVLAVGYLCADPVLRAATRSRGR